MHKTSPILLYLHIPKAGGTTFNSLVFEKMENGDFRKTDIKAFLSGVFYYPDNFVTEPNAASRELVQRALARDDLRAVVGHFRFGLHESLTQPYRYVTVLREPVSRVRSLYEFQRLNERKYGALKGIRLADDVDLARYVSQPPYPEVDNGMTRRLSGQSPPIGMCTQAMLKAAKANLERHFEVVGLTEKFDETVVLTSRLLGWGKPPLYYPMNVNTERQKNDEFRQDFVEVIRSRNALDVELYDFAAAIFEQKMAQMGDVFVEMVHEYQSQKRAWYDKHNLL